ncbi:hypothetical protein M2475_001684 [Breznakia sp. PF5-3]|nr:MULTISPECIES: hypothetical protein [unclassified Breznakia]MDF9825250.1 hypothetical protein [Breznakia sp. PM6-1]MDF9836108.1 hypothetical protein [Breznakia sp. PF5-3]MDF9838403.1 hypothetical protein [Breznakia sp. PFB2-8]MDF9860419.1 hypothetical protein [Breznakia sp. PH5-24]
MKVYLFFMISSSITCSETGAMKKGLNVRRNATMKEKEAKGDG